MYYLGGGLKCPQQKTKLYFGYGQSIKELYSFSFRFGFGFLLALSTIHQIFSPFFFLRGMRFH